MMVKFASWMGLFSLTLVGSLAWAQVPNAAPSTQAAPALPPPPFATSYVAATVNGQNLYEVAIYRALAEEYPEGRKDILHLLIDHILIEQYLVTKVAIDAKEIDEKITQLKEDAKRENLNFEEDLKKFLVTEEELRRELTAALRWEKFAQQQATDANLKKFFEKNPTMFDGSQVEARHILFEVNGSPAEKSRLRALEIKKLIEDRVAQNLAQLPAGTDNLAREKQRIKVLEEEFAAQAASLSGCPTKKQGGHLDWFPRAGKMVEPFARAAFALKPFQISEPVATEFGYHLILVIDTKPGLEVKFEDVKPAVRDIFCDHLRDAVLAAIRPQAKLVVNPVPAKK